MNPRLKSKTCVTCGAVFTGGPTATYCPDCRAERIRQRDRERHQRKLAGKIRPLGSTDLCAICDKPYIVNAGPQKHCPACQVAEAKRKRHEAWINEYYGDPEKRQKYINRSRQWAINHPDRTKTIAQQSYLRTLQQRNENRRKMYGYKLRPLGRTENCPKCSNVYIVRGRNQKYCDQCRSR